MFNKKTLQEQRAQLSPEQRAQLQARLRQAGTAAPEPERIAPRPAGTPAVLSFSQQRLWFIHQLDPQNPSYNEPGQVCLDGDLDQRVLERCLLEIVRRHEVLHSTMQVVDGQPILVVADTYDCRIPLIDLSGLPPAEQDAALRQLVEFQIRIPFDLRRDFPWRHLLFRFAPQTHQLLFTYHHIAYDRWSMAVIQRELSALYQAFVVGRPSPLPPLPIQYADYAIWQRAWLQGAVLEQHLTYWRTQLAGAPMVLELPTDLPRPALQTLRGASIPVRLEPSLVQALRGLARQYDVTLFMVLLGAVQVWLSRHSGQDDVIVGSPIANRTRIETEGLIGCFINTLALRGRLAGVPSFVALLAQVRTVTLDAYAHQDLPFEHLVDALGVPRDLSRQPLVQALLTLQNVPATALELPGLTLTPLVTSTTSAKFDLCLTLNDAPDLYGMLEYNSDLFTAATVERWVERLVVVLRGVVAQPTASLAALPLLTPAEYADVVLARNATAVAYPHTSTTHALFAAQAVRTPEAIALAFITPQHDAAAPVVPTETHHLTYDDLHARALRLASFLVAEGVTRTACVAVCMERSPELLIAILGIWFAGAAFLPLDPAFPQARMAFMLDDAQASLLLTHTPVRDRVPDAPTTPLCIDQLWMTQIAPLAPCCPDRAEGADLAYVIYTSGSTGRPKGVMVPHQGLVNYLVWALPAYTAAAGRGAPVQSSIAADAIFPSLFAPLLAGTCVVLLPESEALAGLSQALTTHAPFSLIKITPSQLAVLNPQLPGTDPAGWVHTLVVGAEALWGEVVTFWQKHAPETRLLNEYGPTETVVGCSIYPIPPETTLAGAVPIGVPIANTQFYVLDRGMQPVPVGVAGELYIGGDGVAWGYLGRAELTAERFVPNPFPVEVVAGVAGQGSRLYRTGDVVRSLADPVGNITFVGRMDEQVKVRGYRIELGEIEVAIRAHAGVQDAIVVVREDTPGDKRLVAYVVLEGDHAADSQATLAMALRMALRDEMPDYMVPSTFMVLDAIPLTSNGKLDRRALPAPDANQVGTRQAIVAPRTPLEATIAEVWEGVLGVAEIGIYDNFFALGGHSLLVAQVVARLQTVLALEIPMRTLFASPTVAELAVVVAAIQAGLPLGVMGSADPDLDVRAEVQLDPQIVPPIGAAPVRFPAHQVLLTGATGFLGAHLLAELLNHTPATVHCLVRADDSDAAMARICDAAALYGLTIDVARVVPLVGDLTKARFGLTSATFRKLAEQVDVIYHAGALLNQLHPYHVLRATNVHGTHEVLRLAALCRSIPVHYISTTAIFSPYKQTDRTVLSELDLPELTMPFENGYQQSKWVAEQLVMAARGRGLPVTVYRPGRITGATTSGTGSIHDPLYRVIKGCVALGALPDAAAELLGDVVDMTPVDYVSAAVVQLAQQPHAIGRFYHVVNPRPAAMGEIIAWIGDLGYPLQQWAYADWRAQLLALARESGDPVLQSSLPLFSQLLPVQPHAGKRGLRFDCQQVLAELANTPVCCPPFDHALLQRYFAYFVRLGLLPGPAVPEREVDSDRADGR